MGWIDAESMRLLCPDFAHELEGREALQVLEPAGEVGGVHEVAEVSSKLVVGLVVVALHRRLLGAEFRTGSGRQTEALESRRRGRGGRPCRPHRSGADPVWVLTSKHRGHRATSGSGYQFADVSSPFAPAACSRPPRGGSSDHCGRCRHLRAWGRARASLGRRRAVRPADLPGRRGPRLRCGDVARDRLKALIGARPVDCRERDRDSYGRMVARCLAGSADLGEAWSGSAGRSNIASSAGAPIWWPSETRRRPNLGCGPAGSSRRTTGAPPSGPSGHSRLRRQVAAPSKAISTPRAGGFSTFLASATMPPW